MGILFWRGRVSKAEFRRAYIAAVRKRLPQVECREANEDGELSIEITGVGNQQSLTQRLDNAYVEFRNAPRERDEIVGRWLDNLASLITPHVPDPQRFVPLLKSRDYLRGAHPGGLPEPGSAGELFHDVVNQELILCYVDSTGSGFHFLTRAEVAAARLNDEEIRAIAHRNLKARTAERSFVEGPFAWLVSVGGNFEATMLIDDELWNDARFAGQEWVLAAVPDRNTLIASVDSSAQGVWALADFAARLAKSESYPISSRIFVRREGRFEDLDPLIEDPGHPIPRLDVIDVGATTKSGSEHAVIVIASALDAGPRSIYRLHRKLYGYLAHLGCDGTPARQAVPQDERPQIRVHLHRDSDAEVFALLNSLGGYVSQRGAQLEIETE